MRDSLKYIWQAIATPENIWALLLFLMVIALLVLTTDSSPVWIYQGF